MFGSQISDSDSRRSLRVCAVTRDPGSNEFSSHTPLLIRVKLSTPRRSVLIPEFVKDEKVSYSIDGP